MQMRSRLAVQNMPFEHGTDSRQITMVMSQLFGSGDMNLRISGFGQSPGCHSGIGKDGMQELALGTGRGQD